MLDTLLALVPIFTLIGLGWLARQRILADVDLTALNLFVLYFAVPALLFKAAYDTNLAHLLYWPGILAFSTAIIINALLIILLLPRLFPGNQSEARTEGAIIRALNGTFSNLAYIGIPLITGLLGEQASAPLFALIITGNILIIAGTQVLIEALRLRQYPGSLGRQLARTLYRAVLINPVLIAPLIGMLLNYWAIPLWQPIDKTLSMLAPAAVPVALFTIGAGLHFSLPHRHRYEVGLVIGIKLIFHPIITLLCLWAFAITDPIWLTTAILLAAIPTGALGHVLAVRYGHFQRQSAQVIVLSTLLSIISLSIWAQLLTTLFPMG